MVLEKKSGFRVVKGITTDDGAFRQVSVRRIVDFAKAGTRIGSLPYIGRLNNARVRGALKATLNGFLADMVLNETIDRIHARRFGDARAGDRRRGGGDDAAEADIQHRLHQGDHEPGVRETVMANTNVYRGSDGALVLAVDTGVEGEQAKAVIDQYSLTAGRASHGRGSAASNQTSSRSTSSASDTRPSCARATSTLPGSIERACVNGALLKLLLGDAAATAARRRRSSARRSTSTCASRTRSGPASPPP